MGDFFVVEKYTPETKEGILHFYRHNVYSKQAKRAGILTLQKGIPRIWGDENQAT